VTGAVVLEGAVPEPEPIDMDEEPFCAARYADEGPMTQEVLVSDGGLANVFVYVKEGLDRDFPAPAEPGTLDQEGCRYRPHVLGLQSGQPLQILNSDSLLHNINAQPTENRGFNISQPQAGMSTTREFTIPEVMIPVKCDVHGWMGAYIGVLDHPFHSVSATDGSFRLAGLPPGDYVIEAWHERYGTRTAEVSVAPRDTATVSFTFREEMAATAEVPLADPLFIGPDGVRRGSHERPEGDR